MSERYKVEDPLAVPLKDLLVEGSVPRPVPWLTVRVNPYHSKNVDPTQEEITRMRKEIQSGWTEADERVRRTGTRERPEPMVIPTVKLHCRGD